MQRSRAIILSDFFLVRNSIYYNHVCTNLPPIVPNNERNELEARGTNEEGKFFLFEGLKPCPLAKGSLTWWHIGISISCYENWTNCNVQNYVGSNRHKLT